jgi:hypothetical protein
MPCVDKIDCGSSLLSRVVVSKSKANLPRSLGFSDVYRHSALGADNFTRMEKASEGLLEGLATLRALALERVQRHVKIAGLGHVT